MKTKLTVLFFLLVFGVAGVLRAEAKMQSVNQDTKGSTMELTRFVPQMMDSPFDVKYPERWYVREEYWGYGRAAVFFTREKIEKDSDKYLVGVSVIGMENKFSQDGPFEAKVVPVLQDIEKQMKILKAKDIEISGKRATKVWVENETKKGIAVIIPVGRGLFLINADALKSEFPEYEGVLEKIIASFKWRLFEEKAKNPPKPVDPVMDSLVSGHRYNVVVNGKARENVLVADVVKEFMQKGEEKKLQNK